jgi:hypothetical protein
MRTDLIKHKEAVRLRRRGLSIKKIQTRTGVSLSTLSGWLRKVELTEKQRTKLHRDWRQALVKARVKAVKWHRTQREERERIVRNKVDLDYKSVIQRNRTVTEIALAMLYLGEGAKTRSQLGLGNSDPKVVRFYVDALRKLYSVPDSKLRVDLHLRADQDERTLKRYWSRQINVPLSRFNYVIKDKRTVGKPTYPGYKGVCFVAGGGVEIQRRLLYLAEVLCVVDARG